MSLTLLSWRREVAAIYQQVRVSTSAQHAHAMWRTRRDELFAHHPDSPLVDADRRRFSGLSYADYDASLRFEAPVEIDVEQVRFVTETGTDGLVAYRRFGQVQLGPFGMVDLWWLEGYGGGVFLPLADRSPKNYGGGRYVVDTAKGADLGGEVDLQTGRGTLVVDLNFSYNPSCAYDPAWACPLAPMGNRVDDEINAGEYRFDA